MNRNSPLGWVLAALLLSLLTAGLLLSLPTDVWDAWRPATCLKKGCFCEQPAADSPVRQAANSFSSLAFVLSGALIARRQLTPRLPYGYALVLGLASTVVGVGSAFYHASLTFIGQFFDVFGMFLVAAFMLVYAWERLWGLRRVVVLGLYLLLNGLLSWLQWTVPELLRPAFAGVVLLALLFELLYLRTARPPIDTRWLGWAAGLLALAFLIWILDNARLVCSEHSLIQGHAVWHILGACSVWLTYRYYASEAG